jgi:Fe-S-cluster containining protein
VARVPVFCLSFHVPYSCRHSGACCSSGWDVALEKSRVGAIERALADHRLTAPARWLGAADGAPDDIAGVLARNSSGACVFHRAPGCAIHSALGQSAMPSACRHFPRIALIDRRGVFVTLSHYCPTAAALLFETEGPASIVEGPPVLPGGAVPEGLDAREALPPSASPRRLMDWESYAAWEARAVHTLTSGVAPARALDAIGGGVNRVPPEALFQLARAAVPSPLTWPEYLTAESESVLDEAAAVVGRYLAAHAFASWMAYQGNGLAATILYLRVALAVLTVEVARHGSLRDGIRQADLLLRHLVDRETLAARLSVIAAR